MLENCEGAQPKRNQRPFQSTRSAKPCPSPEVEFCLKSYLGAEDAITRPRIDDVDVTVLQVQRDAVRVVELVTV